MGSTQIKQRVFQGVDVTDKERTFVNEYVVDWNSKRAAIAAGYSVKAASSTAYKLLQKPVIQQMIGAIAYKKLQACEIDPGQVLEQLLYLATRRAGDHVYPAGHPRANQIKDICDMDDRAQSTVNGIEQKILYETITDNKTGTKTIHTKIMEVKLKLTSKETGIDMAMRHKGLYKAVELAMSAIKEEKIDWSGLHGEPEDYIDVLETKINSVGEAK